MSRQELYHVTLLSNFARAFDKYSRVYSKTSIPESHYPNQFFLLRRDELAIGVARARALLARTGLAGDRLLILRTTVATDELQPNLRTGLGRSVPRPWITLDGVSFLDGGETLVPIGFEEACAASLHVLTPELRPYEDLAPRSVSLLPIARGCQASCPFCFSEASVSLDQPGGRLDPMRVRSVLAEARRRGAGRAVITGGGEPGLLRFDRLLALVRECAAVFPRVVLITNGWFLQERPPDVRTLALAQLAEAGLTVLSVSYHHHEVERNAAIMRLRTEPGAIAAAWAAGRERWPSLRLRWVCVLQRGGIDSAEALADYLDTAAALGVPEVCFKELYVSTSQESVYHSREANEWGRRHQVPLSLVLDVARSRGWEEVARLPWGAPIYRGEWRGRALRVAAYTEPSLFWERRHGLARSWNLMADGRCLASLEDRDSEVCRDGLSGVPGAA
jgi:molybdenum cofactor biosynthesis enzyme MoaA